MVRLLLRKKIEPARFFEGSPGALRLPGYRLVARVRNRMQPHLPRRQAFRVDIDDDAMTIPA
jgi:hypothetical protein